MNVLGIADNHASGATLVQDGKLTFAVNQERFDRIKNSGNFPYNAIDAVMQAANLEPQQIDLIALASDITPSCVLRRFKPWHFEVKKSAGQFSIIYNLYVIYQVFARYFFPPLYALDRWLSKLIIGSQLRKKGFFCKVVTVEHHDAHAYSAFLTSPFNKATVITADAMGDGVSVTVGVGHPDGSVERIYEQSGATSLNPYYSRTTEFLGFIPNRHEGKLTGLAAYGNPEPLLPTYRNHMHFIGPGFTRLNLFSDYKKDRGIYRELARHTRENVSAALQRNLEIEMNKFVKYWVKRTGIGDVCLAGGIFENVKLNQRIHQQDAVENIYIFPNMSDGGLSTGAALHLAGVKPAPLKHAYLGPKIELEEMTRAVTESGLPFEKPADPAQTVADLLAKGEVVCRFDGRMEYGPRALGHRSVLSRATDPEVNNWLNDMLKRSEFMPFAPAVLDEDAKDCFVNAKGALFTARFMNICFDCTPSLKKTCPGVVHVDGTARPQIVSKSDDEVYYEIIRRFRDKTGLKAIINTSYNMHEEPIVATPEQALKAFVEGGFKYLLLGPYLVRGSEG